MAAKSVSETMCREWDVKPYNWNSTTPTPTSSRGSSRGNSVGVVECQLNLLNQSINHFATLLWPIFNQHSWFDGGLIMRRCGGYGSGGRQPLLSSVMDLQHPSLPPRPVAWKQQAVFTHTTPDRCDTLRFYVQPST